MPSTDTGSALSVNEKALIQFAEVYYQTTSLLL